MYKTVFLNTPLLLQAICCLEHISLLHQSVDRLIPLVKRQKINRAFLNIVFVYNNFKTLTLKAFALFILSIRKRVVAIKKSSNFIIQIFEQFRVQCFCWNNKIHENYKKVWQKVCYFCFFEYDKLINFHSITHFRWNIYAKVRVFLRWQSWISFLSIQLL